MTLPAGKTITLGKKRGEDVTIPDHYKLLRSSVLIGLALESDSQDEIVACLEELTNRKRVSTKKLKELYEHIWTLASANAQVSIQDNEDDILPKPTYRGPFFPTTDVIKRTSRRNPSSELEEILPPESGLHMAGYHVGKEGLKQHKRQELLINFLRNHLHPKIIETFGDEYGKPDSRQRVLKMANVIAGNCRLKKLNDAKKYRVAITDWEDDLAFLKEKCFIPLCKGKPILWPDTEVTGETKPPKRVGQSKAVDLDDDIPF